VTDATSTAGLPGVLRLGGAPLPVLDRARLYVCGITPYDVTHLGHAATFVWVDTLVRVLGAVGTEVAVCRNVTDVDDVLSVAARRAGTRYDEFAAVRQFYFDRDMRRLAVRQPAFEPRAHCYINQVMRIAQALLDADRAYVSAGSVYFRGAAAVAGAGLGEGDAGREEAVRLLTEYGGHPDDPAKRDPFDSPVWQSSGPDDPAWDSPWGPGRPGWHAECAAMALSTFGPAIDVHAGGKDLAFPHHAYESAMVEAVTGVIPFARRWMHVGVVGVGGVKMAKSTGNLVLVADLVERYPGAALRLLVLDRPWARDWDFDVADLDRAAGRLDGLCAAAGRRGGSEAAEDEVTTALLDDLDVPRALRVAEEAGGAAARSATTVLGLV